MNYELDASLEAYEPRTNEHDENTVVQIAEYIVLATYRADKVAQSSEIYREKAISVLRSIGRLYMTVGNSMAIIAYPGMPSNLKQKPSEE